MAAPTVSIEMIGDTKTFIVGKQSMKLVFEQYAAQTAKWHEELKMDYADDYNDELLHGDRYFLEVFYYEKKNSNSQPSHTRITFLTDNGDGTFTCKFVESKPTFAAYLKMKKSLKNGLEVEDADIIKIKVCNFDALMERRKAYLAWKEDNSVYDSIKPTEPTESAVPETQTQTETKTKTDADEDEDATKTGESEPEPEQETNQPVPEPEPEPEPTKTTRTRGAASKRRATAKNSKTKRARKQA